MKPHMILGVLTLSLVGMCHAELFSALATMKRALYIEKKLAKILRSYTPLIHEESRRQRVNDMATEYDRHADLALEDAETFLANPINAYMLCKRFTTELPAINDLLWSAPLKAAFDSELGLYRGEMPTTEDLNGVIDAILRLQDTYEIPVYQFVDGTFSPVNNSASMTASDCFEIGRYAYLKADKYHALMWLLEALAIYDLEGEPTMDIVLLLDFLVYSASDQGNNRHALLYARRLLAQKPINEAVYSRMTSVVEWLNTRIDKEDLDLLSTNSPIPAMESLPAIINHKDKVRMSNQETRNYESLCRGEDGVANPYEHQLSCHYSTVGNNPLLILAPAKVEEKYRNPDMAIFHDVVSDNEIEIIKMISTPLLARADVFDPKTGKLVKALYRISRSSWINDWDHPTIASLTKRIAAMTNLDMGTVEPLQVVNYGIGGQYDPHYDHARSTDGHQFEAWRGNRIATWIFYFSDVAAGGLTVFTEIGVKISPKKGTAAFWWNLKKNGEGNPLTRHAGCPVLAGSKWVANKWMHARGQEWRRPCGLSEDE